MHLVAAVTPSLVERGVKAGEIVKVAAQVTGGGGGGRDTMAQAGGQGPGEARRGARGGPRRDRRQAAGLVRVLALDYGSARCGCAVSDPTGTLATPIEPVERPDTKRGMNRIVGLVRERGIGRIVVGLPIGAERRRYRTNDGSA